VALNSGDKERGTLYIVYTFRIARNREGRGDRLMDNNRLKLLVEMSETVEEADGYIEQYMGYNTIQQKLAFLNGLFSVVALSKYIPEGQVESRIESDDYYGALFHIIQRKLRG